MSDMSRTFKDQPWDVQGWRLRHTWRVIKSHRLDCEVGHSRRWVSRGLGTAPCDIDEQTRPRLATGRGHDTCYYTFSYYGTGGVPSWFVRQEWWSPDRRRVRDRVNDLRREYNAHGDLADGDVCNAPGRNSAHWDWY